MKRLQSVLISGAGIAGPALALWLDHYGIRSTIVERAPTLRRGGQAVDFRGPVHREVLERSGLWHAIHERRTHPGKLVLLDRAGQPHATLPEVMTAGDVEILRGDLCEILHQRTKARVDYRFGACIEHLEERGGAVVARIGGGREESFDLVVGADGLHSGVRSLVFGEEGLFLRHHGYRIATFSLPNLLGSPDSLVYSVPGRAACISPAGADARALLVHRSDGALEGRRDVAAQRAALRSAFHGVGWEVPRVLSALDVADDLYVDAIATVHMPAYAKGRVALLGDAAYGGTLGGQGTSLAIVGAYVLAAELARAPSHQLAFQRYEERMRGYATGCQKGAMRAGSFFAPKTRLGLFLRNAAHRALTRPSMLGLFERMVKAAASDFSLPPYDGATLSSARPASNETIGA